MGARGVIKAGEGRRILVGHSAGQVRVDLGLPVPDPRGFPTRGHGCGYTAGTGGVRVTGAPASTRGTLY